MFLMASVGGRFNLKVLWKLVNFIRADYGKLAQIWAKTLGLNSWLTSSRVMTESAQQSQQEDWEDQLEEYSRARENGINYLKTLGGTEHQVKFSFSSFFSSETISGSGGVECEVSTSTSPHLPTPTAGWQWRSIWLWKLWSETNKK